MKRHPHRGVVIAGHPTSLRLEPMFWDFLREIAYERQLSLSELINAINRAKSSKANLASALRVFVAQHYHSAAVLKGCNKSHNALHRKSPVVVATAEQMPKSRSLKKGSHSRQPACASRCTECLNFIGRLYRRSAGRLGEIRHSDS